MALKSSRNTSSTRTPATINAGFVDQAHHDVEATLLSSGHVLGHPVPETLEVHLLEQRLAAGLDDLLLQAVEHAVVHHLVTGTGAAERATGLRDVTDAAPYVLRLRDHVVTGHHGRAGGGPQQRGQHPKRRRLARTVGAEETDDLPLRDVEIDAVDGLHLGAVSALLGVEDCTRPRAWITVGPFWWVAHSNVRAFDMGPLDMGPLDTGPLTAWSSMPPVVSNGLARVQPRPPTRMVAGAVNSGLGRRRVPR